MTEAFITVAAALHAGFATWWRVLLGAALGIAPAFLLGQCSVDIDQACRDREAEAQGRAAQDVRAADTVLAADRRRDEAAIATQAQIMKEATSALPDQPTTARQRTRACLLLRQDGFNSGQLHAAGC